MDRRGIAHLACRLLAVYLVVNALAAAPVIGASILLAGDAEPTGIVARVLEQGRPIVFAVAGGVLWFAAAWLSRWMAGPAPPPASSRRGAPPDVPRFLVMLAGLMVLVGAIGDLVTILQAMLPGPAGGNGLPAPWVILAPGLALVLRAAVGIVMMAASGPIARTLRLEAPAAIASRVNGGGEDPSMRELLSGLVGAAGTHGVRLAAELALAIKSEAEGVAKRVVKSSLDAVIAAVESRRPDFGAATAADGAVTIVFSDMEGFTAMTQRLGDEDAHEVIKIHNRIVRRALKAHRGQEVELQGDGFLLAFPSAESAVRCAGQIQSDCAKHSEAEGAEPIRVRIGLHSGTPIKEGDRFFGLTVILAARIAAQASGGQTLVSSAVREALEELEGYEFDEGREAALKGLEGMHRIYEVRRFRM